MSITQDSRQATGTGQEATELLETLAERRFFLRQTVRNLTLDQATSRPTVSELTLAGLVKHVGEMEAQWVRFIVEGTEAVALPENWESDPSFWREGWRLAEGESLENALATWETIAAHTEEVVRGLPDLNVAHALPPAPWFRPGASWSARRTLLHLIGEISQHSGHADIIRESIDGQKTMG
ncbi:DinB family protein [Kineosporia sp. J2-2]|uniref:DinB family protein n=1 Tax=Kineosporia corallincola TaxID=2835133 RepID=A0ABS5TPG8_9ACTN|nr:DinB family protein [Kineosporia corallincola]MBT0772718.1 DinB family protein [Kineosporia corallincola]